MSGNRFLCFTSSADPLILQFVVSLHLSLWVVSTYITNYIKWFLISGILDLKNSKTIRNKVSIPGTKSTAILFYFQAEKMGCGRVRNEKRVIIVCNYAPGLDVGAGSIYLQGRPCSGCRHENCGAIYGNLCGKIVIEKPSDYKPPFVLGTAYRLDVINIVLLVASQFIAFTYL